MGVFSWTQSRTSKHLRLKTHLNFPVPSLIMAALSNRAGHYIFALWFLLSIFLFFLFSSPNLSRRRLHVCHTWTYGVVLVRIYYAGSETCCTRLAENTGRKKSPKIRHLSTIAQLCRAISSQLRHIIEKNLLNSDTSPTCSYNMVNFSSLAAEIG